MKYYKEAGWIQEQIEKINALDKHPVEFCYSIRCKKCPLQAAFCPIENQRARGIKDNVKIWKSLYLHSIDTMLEVLKIE